MYAFKSITLRPNGPSGLRHLVLLLVFITTSVVADQSEDFNQLLREEWDARQADNPFLEDVIESESPQPMTVSPGDYARRASVDQDFHAQLLKIDRSALSAANQLNYDILEFVLRYRIELARFKPYRMPFVSSNGFFNNIAITLSQSPRFDADDVETYIGRIRALPEYFDQQISNMRAGLDSGFTMPQEIMGGVLGVVEAQLVENYAEHPLWAPFEHLPAGLTPQQEEQFRTAGREAIETLAMPAYGKVHQFATQTCIRVRRHRVPLVWWHIASHRRYHRPGYHR